MSALTRKQRELLEFLRGLELEKKPFGHREIARALGDKTHHRSWKMMQRLIDAGFIDERGKRLAIVECPVVSSAGRRALKRAA